MEGVCIFYYKGPVLIMYKEIEKNKVLLVIYYNRSLKYTYITNRQLTNLIPRESVHILTKLPYYNNLDLTLRFWKILIYNKLIRFHYPEHIVQPSSSPTTRLTFFSGSIVNC